MFWVTDSSGNVKATAATGGVSLSDPLAVSQGGFGITQAPKGGIPYASATNTWAYRVPDTDNDIQVPKLLTNVLFPGETAATDPRLGLVPRWVAMSYFAGQGGSGVGMPGAFRSGGNCPSSAVAYGSTTIWTAAGTDGGASTIAPTTFVTDSTSTWERYTTGAAGGTAWVGWRSLSIHYAQHNPTAVVKFRTGSDITGYRFHFSIRSTAALVDNTNDQSSLNGVGMRYSTSASDTGFTSWVSNGSVQVIGAAQFANIAASTVYTASISINNGVATLTVIQGSTVSQTTVLVPIDLNNNTLVAGASVANSSGSGTRDLDFTAVYISSQMSIAP